MFDIEWELMLFRNPNLQNISAIKQLEKLLFLIRKLNKTPNRLI